MYDAGRNLPLLEQNRGVDQRGKLLFEQVWLFVRGGG
jgi:hypothetical protein